MVTMGVQRGLSNVHWSTLLIRESMHKMSIPSRDQQRGVAIRAESQVQLCGATRELNEVVSRT